MAKRRMQLNSIVQINIMTPEKHQEQIDEAVDNAVSALVEEIDRLNDIIRDQQALITQLNKLTDVPL